MVNQNVIDTLIMTFWNTIFMCQVSTGREIIYRFYEHVEQKASLNEERKEKN